LGGPQPKQGYKGHFVKDSHYSYQKELILQLILLEVVAGFLKWCRGTHCLAWGGWETARGASSKAQGYRSGGKLGICRVLGVLGYLVCDLIKLRKLKIVLMPSLVALSILNRAVLSQNSFVFNEGGEE
jgi:hypothetical protein